MENKQPIFKTFAKGVQVLVWKNEKPYTKDGITRTITSFNCKPENTYLDRQGIRKESLFFEIDKLPLLIASLQKVYNEFSVSCYKEGKPVKNSLE